jgi:hypothetical protein
MRRRPRLPDPNRPARHDPGEDREVDYLLCRECGTPCYVFDLEAGVVSEAQCLVCGNDEPMRFTLGEEAGSDDDD